MQNFEKAMESLIIAEGYYDFDPKDPGGETFCGIARNIHPLWNGWALIDGYKNDMPINNKNAKQLLLDNAEIKSRLYAFYRKEFWDYFSLDNAKLPLALEIFEQAVNLGQPQTARHLQKVLNALNYTESKGVEAYGPDLTVDGQWGAKSRNRFQAMLNQGYEKYIQYAVNALQGSYYVQLALEKPQTKRRYFKGWIGQRTHACASENHVC